jgi:hypothetical protein
MPAAPLAQMEIHFDMSVLDIFAECNKAVVEGVQIKRANRSDKEFHFQNWFVGTLAALGLNYDPPRRNTYPDFRLVASTVGFELKGLEFPGRVADFDCNSQVCTGFHNGRSIYYVFGRYPKRKEKKYPVLDLVICHGNFLNARHDYIHENKSFRGFGSYGDILVRDRKMYVAPTPFGLLDGIDRQVTLILLADEQVDSRFRQVAEIERVETQKIVTKYTFNLKTNDLITLEEDNPTAGTVHCFRAYRIKGAPATEVKMKGKPVLPTNKDADEAEVNAENRAKRPRRKPRQ